MKPLFARIAGIFSGLGVVLTTLYFWEGFWEIAPSSPQTIYACPRHPESRQAKRGSCPTCGEPLLIARDTCCSSPGDTAASHHE